MSDTENTDDMAADVEAAVRSLSSDEPANSTHVENSEEAAQVAAEVTAQIEPEERSEQIQPPSSWPRAAKDEFAKLSLEVQQAVLKREEEISNGQRQYSDERSRLKDIDTVISPHREYYRQFGFSDTQAINHLVSLEHMSRADPVQFLSHYLKSLPPAHQQQIHQAIVSAAGQQPQFTQDDFNRAVQQEVHRQMIHFQIAEFEKNPPVDYQQYKPLMIAALQANQADSLEAAYQLVSAPARHAAAEAARLNSKRQATNASLNGAPHGVSVPSKPNGKSRGQFIDIAEDVRAAMASLG